MIKKIETSLDRVLHIDLEDQKISIRKLGVYENQTWFSWSVWDTEEGELPLFRSKAVTKEKILERISLLSEDKDLSSEVKHSINLMFGHTV